MVRGSDLRFVVERGGGPAAALLEVPGVPLDAVNAAFGPQTSPLYRILRPLYEMPRMSSHAIAAIINTGVRRMARESAFVNVGVWRGFSLLSGMAGNPDRTCIGVDNFSESGSPREAFLERFERHRSARHEFCYMGYEEYFEAHHGGPIGFYLYDGNHAYEHQLRGLQVAERFFTDDCVVLVDDTNMPEAREGTLDFIDQSERDYAVLLDERTAENRHPTFWNGVMVLQAIGASDAPEGQAIPAVVPSTPLLRHEPIEVKPDSLVSLVVWDPEPDARALGRTIERTLAQTWPNVEVVIVANPGADHDVADTMRGFEDRVVAVESTDAAGTGPRIGLERSRGEFVSVVDSHVELDEAAVEMGLALPGLVRFDRGAPPPRRAFRAGQDIGRVLPRGEPYVFVDGAPYATLTIGAGPALSLVAKGEDRELLDDAAALARIERMCGEGARFVVVAWTAFAWLSTRPLLEQRLRSKARCLLENERVLVFELPVEA
jgi:hypothetical protein